VSTDTDKLGRPPARLKRSIASLIGGVACGLCTGALYLLLAEQITVATVGVGIAIGAGLGTWVRLADL